MLEDLILSGLEGPDVGSRRDALEELRESVRESGGHLLIGNLRRLFQLLKLQLTDGNWDVAHQTMELLGEVIPEFGPDLDNYMSFVLPTLVEKLGDSKALLRRSALATLKRFLEYTTNADIVFNNLIRYGLEHEDEHVRQESTSAVSTLFNVPNLSVRTIDFRKLIEVLIARLVDRSEAVVKHSVQGLIHIRNLLGDSFATYVGMLSSQFQKLLGEHQHELGPMANVRRSLKTSSAENTHDGSDSPMSVSRPDQDSNPGSARSTGHTSARREREFGFIQQALFSRLKDTSNWKVRSDAIEELQNIVTDLEDMDPVMPHLASFSTFLSTLLHDSNFKIALTTLHIIGTLVDKIGPGLTPVLSSLMPHLTEKLGDPKIVIRQASMLVMNKLMGTLSTKPVLSLLLSFMDHNNWHVREEIINVVIQAQLVFPSNLFDFTTLVSALDDAMGDPKTKVRLVAIEAFAVIQSMVGSTKFRQLIAELDTDKQRSLHDRIALKLLPTINPETGLVEHTYLIQRAVMTPRPSSRGFSTDELHTVEENARHGPKSARAMSSRGKIPFDVTQSKRGSRTSRTQHFFPEDQGDSGYAEIHRRPVRAQSADPAGRSNAGVRRLMPDFEEAASPPKPVGYASRHADRVPPTFQDDSDDRMAQTMPVRAPSAGPTTTGRARPKEGSTGDSQRGMWLPSTFSDSPRVPQKPRWNTQTTRGSPAQPVRAIGADKKAHPEREEEPEAWWDKDGAEPLDTPPRERMQHLRRRATMRQKEKASTPPAEEKKDVPPPRRSFSAHGHRSYAGMHDDKGDDDGPNFSRARIHTMDKLPRRAQLDIAEDKPVRQNPDDRPIRGIDAGESFADYVDHAASEEPPRPHKRAIRRPEDRPLRAPEDRPLRAPEDRPLRAPEDRPLRAPEDRPLRAPEDRPMADDRPIRGSGDDDRPIKGIGTGESFTDYIDRESGGFSTTTPPEIEVRRPRETRPLSKATQARMAARRDSFRSESSDSLASEELGVSATHLEARPRGRTARVPRHPASARPARTGSMLDGAKTVEEVATSELEPVGNPEREFKRAITSIKSNDWYQSWEALTMLRRLTVHHTHVISGLRDVVMDVVAEMNNLRSAVSRNAIKALDDMFRTLGKQMDAFLDYIVPQLLKKTSESNAFLVGAAEAALQAMTESVTESRALTALIPGGTSKNATLRAHVAFFIDQVVCSMGSRILNQRDLEKVLPTLVAFTDDGAPEPRTMGRHALFHIYEEIGSIPDMEKALRRHLPESKVGKVVAFVQSARTKGGYQLDLSTGPATGRRRLSTFLDSSSSLTPGSARPSRAASAAVPRRAMTSRSGSVRSRSGRWGSDDGAWGDLPRMLQQLDARDWRKRLDAVNEVINLTRSSPAGLVDEQSRLARLFDHFLPRISDSNAKVQVAALDGINLMFEAIGPALESSLTNIIRSLSGNLAATSEKIRSLTRVSFDSLMSAVDPSVILQPLSSAAQFGNTRVKPEVLAILSRVVEMSYESKPAGVIKHVVPVALQLMSEGRSEIRDANNNLLRTLYASMGDGLLEYVKGKDRNKHNKLMAVVQSIDV